MGDFPEAGMELTHVLVVSDLNSATKFYRDVLGATIVRDYDGTSCVLTFLSSWLLLATRGTETEDKPNARFSPPDAKSSVAHSMSIRVNDCQSAYETLRSRGAQFLTPPQDSGSEIRCFFRDPDGHLLEISEFSSGPPSRA